jgi:hypothetical protein
METVDPSAREIIRGLIVTGTAKLQNEFNGGFAKLFAGKGIHYWVRYADAKVFRSYPDHRDEEMPEQFVSEMAEAGRTQTGATIKLTCQMPGPDDDPALYDSYDYPYRPPGWL